MNPQSSNNRIAFTDELITSLSVAGKHQWYWDSTTPHFGLVVSPSGLRTFYFYCNFKGRPVKLTLGRFAQHIDARQARRKAEHLNVMLKRGIDPRQALSSPITDDRETGKSQAPARKKQRAVLHLDRPRKKSAVDRQRLLTDEGISLLPPPTSGRTVYYDTVQPGLAVSVSSSGHRSFLATYRVAGGQYRKPVIGYCGAMPLSEARYIAQQARIRATEGIDLMDQQALRNISVPDFCNFYLEQYAKLHKKTWDKDERRIRQYIVPAWGNRRLRDICRRDVALLHAETGKTKPIEANRLKEQLSKMFEVAKTYGHYDEMRPNPAKGMGIKKFKEHKRDRWLKPEELPLLYQSIALEDSLHVRVALWLYLHTGLRKRELLGLRWKDINLGTGMLHLPGERTKSGQPLDQPLSAVAVESLEQIYSSASPWVFPGLDQSKPLNNIDKAWRRVRSRAGLNDVWLHDLRRTLASRLAQSGVSLHIIGSILNQTSQSVTAAYAQLSPSPIRAILDENSKKMIECAKGENEEESVCADQENVVPFKRQKQ